MKEKIDPAIGGRIRDLRKGKHLTRTKLAEQIGISSKFLYDIEFGKKGFSVGILKRIAVIMNVSCDYIIFGSDKGKENLDAAAHLLSKFDDRQKSHILQVMETIYEINNEQK